MKIITCQWTYVESFNVGPKRERSFVHLREPRNIQGFKKLCRTIGAIVCFTQVSSVRTEDPDIRASLHHSLAAIADTRRLIVRTMMEDNLDLLYTDLNIKLRRRDCLSHFGVRMMIGLVMRTASRDQKMTELQNTIDTLLKHLATADEETTLQILIIVQEFVRCMARRMESDNVAGAVEDKTKDKRKGLIKRMILELEEQGKYIRKEILTQALNCNCISELNTGHLLLI